jgi:uncharacterized protein (DUF1015 family)
VAEIRPFRGLRYRVPAADAGRVIAPPYDVISPAQQEALYELSPYNVIRLEYGRERGEARYAAAAATLRAWREAGVLAPEPAPALYLYEQEFTHGGTAYRRRSVVGRVRLEPFESGTILPHEFTMARPKADRLALLGATRTNISPVLSLIDDADGGLSSALDRVAAAPVVDAADFTGQRHRLTVIDDPADIGTIAGAIGATTLYIADGHHRYETALTYLAERRGAATTWTGDEAENFILMAITATADPGLLILPIHRLARPRTAITGGLVEAIRPNFVVEDVGPLEDQGSRDKLVHALAHAGERTNAFGAAGIEAGRLHLLTPRDRAAVERLMPEGHPPAWKALDVNVLQFGILEPLLGIDAAALASGEYVEFSEDAGESLAAVADGRVPLAFLLNATRPEHIIAVAGAGDRMPQKSTYFYPKLGTGLVLNAHDV